MLFTLELFASQRDSLIYRIKLKNNSEINSIDNSKYYLFILKNGERIRGIYNVKNDSTIVITDIKSKDKSEKKINLNEVIIITEYEKIYGVNILVLSVATFVITIGIGSLLKFFSMPALLFMFVYIVYIGFILAFIFYAFILFVLALYVLYKFKSYSSKKYNFTIK